MESVFKEALLFDILCLLTSCDLAICLCTTWRL